MLDNAYIEKLTSDRQADAAYLAIRSDQSGPRCVARSESAHDSEGGLEAVLVFDADGALLGVELLDAAKQLTPAMKEAALDITSGNRSE
ncbi:DUF2283 domain-containing protein [Nocardia sp. NPDC058518]|uniref:DUF2283 domain-containing protein n=1 Tax=Nocardia sp. NPDC058518 TaxID=3346534 RepID=UPI003656A65A